MKRKYNYFYKITNLINGHFYYGIHSTDNLEDGYMGSGVKLHKAYEKYGIDNFTKDILKFFSSREDAALYEAEVVNEELVYNDKCYNVACGGEIGNTIGTFTAFDKSLNEWRRITNKEYNESPGNFIKSPTAGKVVVEKVDNPGIHIIISSDEYKIHKDEYVPLCKNSSIGKIIVTLKDDPGKFIKIPVDEYYKNKNMYLTVFDFYGIKTHPKSIIKRGSICVKDKKGNHFFINKDDERYVSGELIPAYSEYKWTPEQKERLKLAIAGKQKGEKNSQYGTKWINKDGEKIKIKKENLELYLNNGWKLGMK